MTTPNQLKQVVSNCPIMEQTGDGTPVGRCWFYISDGKTCPRHGDVIKAVDYFKEMGKCLLEVKLHSSSHD